MNKLKKLVIIGLGETARLAYEYFSFDSEYKVIYFAADEEFCTIDKFIDLPVISLGKLDNLYENDKDKIYLFVAMGSGELNYQRTRVYQKLKKKKYNFASYISSKAFVWRNALIGENCFILEDNTIQPFTKIGNNVVMWSGNHLGHQSVIEDNCFITSHVVISGFCKIGKNSFIGVNSTIADNTIIGKDNFICSGANVNKSTEDNSVIASDYSKISRVSAKKLCKVKE